VKDYPSIPASIGTMFREIPGASVFDKADGSSCRSGWSRKQGWYKHGRRHGLLDDSNPHLAVVPALFDAVLAGPLEKIARDRRWQHLIVFYEFLGAKSLGGYHEPDDPKFLTLFDVDADKRGILGPAEFRRVFEGQVPTTAFLGMFNWTRGFVERVYQGDVPGVTFEGVVGKAGEGHHLVRAKAKTRAWLDAIRARHGDRAEAIINS
jgi:hypothetical protein